MRRTLCVVAAALLSTAMALAQAGTNNNSTSQEEIKPGTGRSPEILLSPDINQHLTGNVGQTKGAPPDVTAFNSPATAGAVSSGAESTAAVTTRDQMERQQLQDRASQESGEQNVNGPLPPHAFNEGQGGANLVAGLAQQNDQHPGPEVNTRTGSSQREKPAAGGGSALPQSDQAAQDQDASAQNGQTSAKHKSRRHKKGQTANASGNQSSGEVNAKADHNSTENRKDYSGKTNRANQNRKAQPIEGGFHKPGAPVKQPGTQDKKPPEMQQPPR